MLSRLANRTHALHSVRAAAPSAFTLQHRCVGTFTEADMPEVKRKWSAAQKVGEICLSMKNVAAGALPHVEAHLGKARSFGLAMKSLLTLEEDPEGAIKNIVHVSIGVDRGLCGGVSSNTVRVVDKVKKANPDVEHQCVILGKRSAAVGKAVLGQSLRAIYSDSKTKVVPFELCCHMAEYLLYELDNWDKALIYYNEYKNITSFGMGEPMAIYKEDITAAIHAYQLNNYDGEYQDDLIVRNMLEFKLASGIYLAVAENATCEQASRLRSMGAAVENTNEMCKDYEKIYQGLRKDKITNELILVCAAKRISGSG